MGIYLGNLSVNQIEERLGIKFDDEDREYLNETRQEAVNHCDIAVGKWHCFDLPFTFMVHDRDTALDFVCLFSKYDPKTFKECIQIGVETGLEGEQ